MTFAASGWLKTARTICTTIVAVLAMAVAPDGFTFADLTAKVHSLTGQDEQQYTIRRAAYDLRKLHGNHLVVKPDRTRRYQVPGRAARTLTALLTLRDRVHRAQPGWRRLARTRTTTHDKIRIDGGYDTLRKNTRTLLHHLAIDAAA